MKGNITRDGLGAPISGRLETAFRQRESFRKQARKLKSMVRQIVNDNRRIFFNRQDEARDLTDYIDSFADAIVPFTACPVCRDVNPHRSCLCRGQGWVSQGQYLTWHDTRNEVHVEND